MLCPRHYGVGLLTASIRSSPGYEDANNARRLRADPMLQIVADQKLGDAMGSQPTLNRWKYTPSARELVHFNAKVRKGSRPGRISDNTTPRSAQCYGNRERGRCIKVTVGVYMLRISLKSQQTRSKVMDLNCLDELQGLAVIQKDRLRRLLKKNQKSNAPFSNPSKLINDYQRLILSIQKMKFDLGLDEFKGVTRGARVKAPSVTRPDDLQKQQELLDAVTSVNEIFRRRGITARAPIARPV